MHRPRRLLLLWNRYWPVRSSDERSIRMEVLEGTEVNRLRLRLQPRARARVGRRPDFLLSNVRPDIVSLWIEWFADGFVASPEDPESVRKSQEEEFQRRLRGEYEEAQARVGTVVRPHFHRLTPCSTRCGVHTDSICFRSHPTSIARYV